MEWKDIKGYEGLYQVSSTGLVKSLARNVPRGKSFYRQKEIVLKIYLNEYGYKTVTLFRNCKGKTFKVHRLVAAAFIGDSDLHVNHIDLNKINNNVSNLEYVTPAENVRHARVNGAISSGDFKKGSEHTGYKVSIEGKLDIIRRKSEGEYYKDIAAIYNIAPKTVHNIIRAYRLFGRLV